MSDYPIARVNAFGIAFTLTFESEDGKNFKGSLFNQHVIQGRNLPEEVSNRIKEVLTDHIKSISKEIEKVEFGKEET